MTQPDDPVKSSLKESDDLYDIATWEVRSPLDRVAIAIYSEFQRRKRLSIVVIAILLFVAQLAASGYAILLHPTLGVLALLSVVPAFALAAFVWYEDIAEREPLETMAVTYLLGMLFASFAALLNTVLQLAFDLIPIVGMLLFFYLIVGPLEETVKWSAVRYYAYRTPSFDVVIDGAVYGAIAGLGFATVENAIYITREFFAAQSGGTAAITLAFETATQRAFVGPGHVIYAAFSGYYLGLAKFNPGNAGPIVVKGLLIASLIHATYDTIVTYVPFAGLSFVVFVIVYDGIFFGLLYRKLARYRKKYRQAMRPAPTESE